MTAVGPAPSIYDKTGEVQQRQGNTSTNNAPGTRPDVMRKALRSGADVVLLDLEDAVPAEQKATARKAVADLLAELAEVHAGADGPVVAQTCENDGGQVAIRDQPEVHVRINATSTG